GNLLTDLRAVGIVRRNHEPSLAAVTHARNADIPTGDHLADPDDERKWLAADITLDERALPIRACLIHEPERVVHRDPAADTHFRAVADDQVGRFDAVVGWVEGASSVLAGRSPREDGYQGARRGNAADRATRQHVHLDSRRLEQHAGGPDPSRPGRRLPRHTTRPARGLLGGRNDVACREVAPQQRAVGRGKVDDASAIVSPEPAESINRTVARDRARRVAVEITPSSCSGPSVDETSPNRNA